MSRRVVVTGTGILSPIGNSTQEFYNGLKHGTNGIGSITLFDSSNFSVHIAGELKITLEDYFEKRDLNRMDRFTAMALIASTEAVDQAGIDDDQIDKNRIGVIIGSGIGGLNTFEEQHSRLLNSPRRVSPFFIPSMISDIASGQVSIKYGFKGPNYCVVSACATASHAIGDSLRMIKYGDADVIITGGSDASITPMAVAGFTNMKALSKNDDIETANRPFDVNRDGFVMGEGAGVIILEEYEHARARKAKIYCEFAGYGSSGDAHHITAPSEDGEGGKRAMEAAINSTNIPNLKIDYINAHGTSTMADTIELRAVEEVVKDYAHEVSMSSTKSSIGHLLGAAGAAEAIFSVLSIRDQIVPPTINLENPAEETLIDLVPKKHKQRDVNIVMSNSFGFGGTNASVLFKKFLS
jgi:3-oxoacyl-[acyl-carrier-protein] synthase II